MTQENLRQLAKQGNPKALATIINQSLKPKSITAKVGLKDDCLQVLLESAEIPNQQAMVSFIRNGLTRLEVESIRRVKVYGRKLGEESPAWNQSFEMMPEVETPSIPEPTDSENFSSSQTFRAPRRSVPPKVDDSPSTGQTDFQNPRRSSAMSTNPASSPRIDPLSVGNVVSAGLRLYRDHFKSYFGVATQATLWALLPFLVLIPIPLLLIYGEANPAILLLLIPIWLVLLFYGMAKYTANSALISRLAFSELVNKPESVREAHRQVDPKFGTFLRTYIWMFLLSCGVGIGFYILFFIIGLIGAYTASSVQGNILAIVIIVLMIFIAFGVTLSFTIRFFIRFSLWEVPLAIEENINATQTIGRSWYLTKRYVGRIFLILTVALLISSPIYIIVQMVVTLIQTILMRVLAIEPTSVGFQILSFIVGYILGLVSGIVLLPFWQAIKAVIYYDLRSRKEGLDLQMRDSPAR